jgi:hypothetical protein
MMVHSISAHVARYPLSSIVVLNPQLDGIRKYCKPSMVWAFSHPDNYRFGTWRDEHCQFQELGKLIDDYGYSAPNGCRNAQLWAYGHEYGYSHLVHCQNEGNGYSAHIDESPTIDENEVHEGYGLYLMQACHWNELESTAPWYILSDVAGHGETVSAEVLKCTGDRQAIGGSFDTKEAAIEFASEYARDNEFELIEGYEYQSNASGTGIVNTGHYGHYRQVQWNELMILPKSYRTY